LSRVRRIKGTDERLRLSPYTINDPFSRKGRWASALPSAGPLVIEIGCGRGRWLYNAAKARPDCNFLGIDVIGEILMDAIDEYAGRMDAPDNVRFLWFDAKRLAEIFAPGEVAEIYLHFSDPWPKNRHAKRRLTHADFLSVYHHILAKDGVLHFKTDSSPFFDFSLDELAKCGWTLTRLTRDLYADLPEDNIATEYERRFHRRGIPIKALDALPPQTPPGPLPYYGRPEKQAEIASHLQDPDNPQ
jgi:tRNA (guanine-N7-)-methyltransferase